MVSNSLFSEGRGMENLRGGGHTGLWSIGRWYLSDKYGKFKKMPLKSLYLMVKNVHDSQWTISNFLVRIWEIFLLKIWHIYKKCSNSVNFWARKMFFFFKWVRISPEIDWYHYQGANPAPTCIVWHQTMTKTPMRLSVTSEPSVPPPQPEKEWYSLKMTVYDI